ncbi:UDP-2,3-diacylglucosamine diphosphatase [Novispirillum itersonii]|uniref:UDP-2,3-diacylglucosamine pyrophosphatase LpxH n=1 Tax=Novispirillum itersonii TaxID=189 RepID=A0A7X0DNF5_NOVIT|nr:UDP-2,3-diacylglucosamine diphosphatase [Novispirillum itersonii]MBB6212088.1 UDP-2,3-diacylglucosamine pyrophosphatase LpxH [Novispirillum itersonii]
MTVPQSPSSSAPLADPPAAPRRYRAIFVSDVHLGTRGCKADFLLDFLRHTESETLYLVGDIIDGWRLRKGWYWPQAHNDVVQKLLRKARKGCRVVYVPGNHDEFARSYLGNDFGSIELMAEAEHLTADGRRLLVTHGDAFDGVVLYAKWLALLGDHAYTLALTLNHWFNVVRRKLKLPYWSLSGFLKNRVKNAVSFITNYETAMVEEARRRSFDGVVCGHIHHAELREVDGILYCNDGDWVESCTALVEHDDGRLEIIDWTRERAYSPLEAWQAANSRTAAAEDEDAVRPPVPA